MSPLLSSQYQPRPDNNNVQLLLVHYNGWPHRWDEWIRSDSVRIRPFRTRTHHVIGNNNNTNNNSSSSSSGGGEGGHVTLNTQQFTLLRIIRIGRRRHVSAMLRTHTTIYGLVWWVSLYRYFQCVVVGLALSIATLSLAWIGKGRPQGRLNITILCRSSTSFYAALDGYIQALWFCCCCCLSSIFDSKIN